MPESVDAVEPSTQDRRAIDCRNIGQVALQLDLYICVGWRYARGIALS